MKIENFNFFDFQIEMSKLILMSTSSINSRLFDLFCDFNVVCIILIKICKTFYCCFVKLDFCQFDIIKMLRVFSSNIMLETKMLIVLLIVILRLKIFFEINEMTIDYIVVDEKINKLTIDEKLKTRDKQTCDRFQIIVLLDDELSKNDDTIDRETKFWYICDCQYFCVISKNRS